MVNEPHEAGIDFFIQGLFMTGEPFGAAYRDKQKTLKLLYLHLCTHLK